MSFSVNVDPTNPGQFFACCGLLELADRLWPGAEGHFADGHFHVACAGGLVDFVQALRTAAVTQVDLEDNTSSAAVIGKPFGLLPVEWWFSEDGDTGGRELKVWAGTMESVRIARAMQHAMRDKQFLEPGLFDIGLIAYDAEKKVEPYYFDARRGPNAHSRDVGFSPNDLSLTTTAYPAVELLCFIGLQRSQPAKTSVTRIYDYFTWSERLPPELLPAAVSGLLPHIGQVGYRFENWFRTGQKKHKAFRSAVPHSQGNRP